MRPSLNIYFNSCQMDLQKKKENQTNKKAHIHNHIMKSELRISQGLIVHFLSITYESISHSKFLPSGILMGTKELLF